MTPEIEIGLSLSADSALQDDMEFERTVFNQRHRLFAIALGILRDRGEAEDAVQETLVRSWGAWRNSVHYDDRFAWSVRICVNYCISRRRALTSRGFFSQGALPVTLRAPASRMTDPSVLDLSRAYKRLSLKQRAALTLTKGHGYSIDECATLMGCRPGTVRTHIARGLATLREGMTT